MTTLTPQTDVLSQKFRPNLEGLDRAQRDIVHHGLAVQAEFNTVCAVEYLKSYDIDAEMIERVLLREMNTDAA